MSYKIQYNPEADVINIVEVDSATSYEYPEDWWVSGWLSSEEEAITFLRQKLNEDLPQEMKDRISICLAKHPVAWKQYFSE